MMTILFASSDRAVQWLASLDILRMSSSLAQSKQLLLELPGMFTASTVFLASYCDYAGLPE